MKRKLLQLCAPAGLLIYAVFRIGGESLHIGEALADAMRIASVALMAVGIVYSGWRIGKTINHYGK